MLFVTMASTGCMTLSTRSENCNTYKADNIPVMYSGVYEDIHKFILFPFTCEGEGCFMMPIYPLLLIGGLVDLPLSFIADTLLLPHTITLSRKCEGAENGK